MKELSPLLMTSSPGDVNLKKNGEKIYTNLHDGSRRNDMYLLIKEEKGRTLGEMLALGYSYPLSFSGWPDSMI